VCDHSSFQNKNVMYSQEKENKNVIYSQEEENHVEIYSTP
jgi:hypothetical protein